MKTVYLAGPLFSQGERDYLERCAPPIAAALDLDPVRDLFLPHRDAGDQVPGIDAPAIFRADLAAIDASRLVVAVLDGADVDSGTAMEIGYAFARGKPLAGLLTDLRALAPPRRAGTPPGLNLMILGAFEEGLGIHETLDGLAAALRASGLHVSA